MQTIKSVLLACLTILLFACSGKSKMSSQIFRGTAGWGYNILVDGRIIIHQETVPGCADTKGFDAKPQAEAVARLVMRKLAKGEGPPSVTAQEVAAATKANAPQ